MTTESKSRIPLPRYHEMSVGYSQRFCASLLLLGILAGCSSKEEKPAPPPPGVTATPVVRKDVDIRLSLIRYDSGARKLSLSITGGWNLNDSQWVSVVGRSRLRK